MYSEQVRVSGGDDGRDEVLPATADALLLDAGIRLADPHPAAQDLRGRRFDAVARTVAAFQGLRIPNGLSGAAVIEHALRAIGQGTTDLAAFVQNTFARAVSAGLANAPTIRQFLARTVPLQNFQPTPVAVVEGPASLPRIRESGAATAGLVTARAETVTAATYGADIALTRSAVLAGDLSAALRTAEAAGRAAAWTVDDALVDVLTTNAALGTDSVALFHSTHSNLAGSGAAPSVTTLNAARAALRKQQDASSLRRMNIAARTLLVPAALESTALILAASESSPANPPLNVVVAARLDDTSATGWYLLGDPQVYDTLALGIVGETDELVPIVEPLRGRSFESDSQVFAVRADFGVAALDYRAMFKDPGA